MKRKKSNEQTLGDAIAQLKHALGWTEKLKSAEAVELWPKIVGEYINNYTTEIYVKNKVLFVRISSNALRNELDMSRSKIKFHLNKALEQEFIKEIRILA